MVPSKVLSQESLCKQSNLGYGFPWLKSQRMEKMARPPEYYMGVMDRLTNRATTFIRTIDEEIQAVGHIKPYVKQLTILKEKYLLLAATTERYSNLIFVHSLNKKALDRISQKLLRTAIAFLVLALGLSFFSPIAVATCFCFGVVVATAVLNCLCMERKVKEAKEHEKKRNECTEIIDKIQAEADDVMRNMIPNVIKDLKSSATEFSVEDWRPDEPDDDDF